MAHMLLARPALFPAGRRQGGRLLQRCLVSPVLQHGRFCGNVPVAQQEGTTPAQAEDAKTGVAVPRRRRARPLEFTKNFVLYRSTLGIQEIADHAQRRCQIGGVLAAGGFGAIVVALSAALPFPALAMLTGGASVNCYALVVVASRLIRNLATRHVDRLTIVPLPEVQREELAKARKQEKKDEEEEGELASILFDSATVEERLRATQELQLEIHTGTVVRSLALIDAPPEEEDFMADLDPDNMHREGGPVRRATFGDLCDRLNLLSVDLNNGSCNDQAMLDALLTANKVVVDESLDANPAAGTALAGAGARELLFSEMTSADVEEASKKASKGEPAAAIKKLGRDALIGGASVLVAGGVFLLGESARDPDGVPRWNNLPQLPN